MPKIETSGEIERELARFSQEQLKIIYQNVFALELTEGCSGACDFCSHDAKRGPTDIIPFSVLERIISGVASLTNRANTLWDKVYNYFYDGYYYSAAPKNELRLYNATDPLDYDDGEHDYFDVLSMHNRMGFSTPTFTAIPAGKEVFAIKNLSKISAITISHMNRKRLMPYFKELEVGIYANIFPYISSSEEAVSFDKKYQELMLENPIEETLAELRKKHPRIPSRTRFYDIRIDGSPQSCMVKPDVLFLICRDINAKRNRIVDRDYFGVNRKGRAFNLLKSGYSAFGDIEEWGVKITPKGFFNIIKVVPSEENNSGTIAEKISPRDFNVVRYRLRQPDPLPGYLHYYYV